MKKIITIIALAFSVSAISQNFITKKTKLTNRELEDFRYLSQNSVISHSQFPLDCIRYYDSNNKLLFSKTGDFTFYPTGIYVYITKGSSATLLNSYGVRYLVYNDCENIQDSCNTDIYVNEDKLHSDSFAKPAK